MFELISCENLSVGMGGNKEAFEYGLRNILL